MTSKKHLTIHAHFYQPSREDPQSGAIPDEEGARPYKNWNERIFSDCYLPNIELGNFSKLSFNIGPTLVRWFENQHPEALARIVEADRQNLKRFGVGNAMAQAFHHTILPLMNRRDKQTQIRWGIADFQRVFKRKPQGLWLPETAVDMETLEVLAENGIEFTILAPWQAEAGDLDPRKAYQVILPNHNSIKVFFYHSGLSSRISFDPFVTQNADEFIHQFVKPEYSTVDENQWLLLASDGELYGHHQSFRDKFLSYLLNGSAAIQNVEFSFPALQLQTQSSFPLMKIKNETSWSCHHGIQRWRGVCDCTPHSEWKKHLREGLERIKVEIDKDFEETCAASGIDPWTARDHYWQVFCEGQRFENWIRSQAKSTISGDLKVLEQVFLAELEAQRMFASCGWFFEDLNRIEPKNNLNHAAYAVWLIRSALGKDIAISAMPSFERCQSWQVQLNAADLFRGMLARYQGDRGQG